jgi:hypothetical protein
LHGRSVARARQHAHESVLGDRARGPSLLAVIGKPIVGDLVVNVVRIEERDEQVDVEQRNQRSSLSTY